MKYALIGCGRIAVNHIKAALENHLEIAAVCDCVPERMEKLLEKYGLEADAEIHRYQNYQDLLREEEVDFIAIATESGKHAAIALECIRRGRHIIIEKPIALSLKDADEIIRVSNEKDVLVCVSHQNRFNISVQELRKAVENKRFGKISHGSVHIRWNRNQSYYLQAPWRGTWEQDGGALMNQCIHGIDLLRWMLGEEIEEVYGVTKRQFHEYIDAEDIGMAVVRFKNGAVGTIEGTTNVFPKNLEETLYVFGENGTAKLGGTSANTIDVWDFLDESDCDKKVKGLVEKTMNVYGNGHTSLYYDMVCAIRERRKPYVDACAGRRALELVLAIYQSSRLQAPVKLPLYDCGTMDFSDTSW